MEEKIKTIEYEECGLKQNLKYFLRIKKCNEKITYYINFTYPTNLQVSFTSEIIFDKLNKNDIKEIRNKWESAVQTKYKSKLTDSFNTKFKIFVFYKFLCNQNFDEYFARDISEILNDFKGFEISPKLADAFSSQYYQKSGTENVIYECDNCICEKTVDEITEKLFDYDCDGKRTYEKNYVFDMIKDNYRKEYKEDQKNRNDENLYEFLRKDHLENNELFSLCTFKKLISKTECYYCGINIEQIVELGKNSKLHNKRSDTRGYSLEIDRKSPNLEYSEDNCCMACYWCNNAKTDEFSEDEFKNIAGGINITWNKRLKQIKNPNSLQITFPWKNQVECCK